jgi:hypothetical protein
MIAWIIVGFINGAICGLIGWKLGFDTAYKELDEMMSRMDGNDSLSVSLIRYIIREFR